MVGILRFFEPEESVGNLWHDMANRIGADASQQSAPACLTDLRTTLSVLFRALGGAHDVEVTEAVANRIDHKRGLRRRITHGTEKAARPIFDGERLCLPAVIDDFETAALNRAAYLWLTATAACSGQADVPLSLDADNAEAQDHAYVEFNIGMTQIVLDTCPGLQSDFWTLCRSALLRRTVAERSSKMERRIRDFLRGTDIASDMPLLSRQDARIQPVPFWLDVRPAPEHGAPAEETETESLSPTAKTRASKKSGQRKNLHEANKKNSLIVHRFETILSWLESMDINRTVENDNDENASKAADNQDSVTLSRHDKKAASRLQLHLDLSPAEAEHERIAAKFTYPEWNHRTQSFMPDHCRVLEAEANVPENIEFQPDLNAVERVRRQFEVLRTRRILEKRQADGFELDIDALIAAQVDLRASGRGSDRIYIASRKSQRDLSVGLLLDVSRSTEANMDGVSVIDVSRHALTALAHGLDACGDRFGIWSFSSLRRDRVFLTRCKTFDDPMSARVDRRIAALRPGHYTRMGAAIRHVGMHLAREDSAQKLLLVLTDGKPNDLDHYEGRHGIEDSRMAVREARKLGQVVHGVVIDEDGQDWFARIFERSGFTLLPRPERLVTALPDIYRSLTQEV